MSYAYSREIRDAHEALEARFWAKVRFAEGDLCWEWTASRARAGYGNFRWKRRTHLAHRIAYIWAKGDIQDGYMVDHICSNPSCVRPDHLRAATNKQNSEHHVGANRNSKSGVRGVVWAKHARKWRGLVMHNGRNIHVGYFDSIEEAGAAVADKRREVFTHNDADHAFTIARLRGVVSDAIDRMKSSDG